MAKKRNSTAWLLSWDCTGLESVVNISEYEDRHITEEQRRMWDVLSSPDPDCADKSTTPAQELSAILHRMMIRARYNPQRHYEIYTIGMPADVTQQDIKKMFEDGPQTMADLVRDRGQKYFSDRAIPNQVKIT